MIKLRMLDEVGNNLDISGANLTAKFSRESGGVLEKGQSAFQILNAKKGEVELRLTEFDLSALKVGAHQSFEVEIQRSGLSKKAVFDGCLTILEKNGKKILGGNSASGI
jgi:hypothetical protein